MGYWRNAIGSAVKPNSSWSCAARRLCQTHQFLPACRPILVLKNSYYGVVWGLWGATFMVTWELQIASSTQLAQRSSQPTGCVDLTPWRQRKACTGPAELWRDRIRNRIHIQSLMFNTDTVSGFLLLRSPGWYCQAARLPSDSWARIRQDSSHARQPLLMISNSALLGIQN